MAENTVPLQVIKGSSLETENPATLQIIQGNSRFTTNLYKVLSKTEGNVFFSPISVHAVLSMAYQGAQDTTAQQFAATLGVPEARLAGEGYNDLLNRLNSVEDVTLHMANRVYLMEGFQLLSDFTSAVTKNFLSEVQPINFGKSAEAAKSINGWVEEKTREKIKDLIKADDLNALTRLVLVNAIYFKGNWKHQFDKADTFDEPFYLNDVDSINVPTMHIKKKFYYKEDESLDAQILELPYSNENLSMIIILPKKRNGIAELEQKLAATNLTDITKDLWKTEVRVRLPKFKVEQTIDLEDALIELGLGEIFDQKKANFRGMIQLQPNENLYVSKVIQKAFIEVNEEGSEAAAATGMAIMLCSMPLPPEEFNADHPFIYVLAEKRSNQLFAGRMLQPNV